MKKLLGIIVLGLLFSINSFAKDITIKKTSNHDLTPKPIKNYFMADNEFVRAGKQSQKFNLPHGGCNGQDCKWSAQRVERKVKGYHRPSKKYGKPLYYAWSIYFPKEFNPNWAGSQTLLGQVKMKGVGMPVWMMTISSQDLKADRGFFIRLTQSIITAKKHCGKFKAGEWIDIIVKADYAKEKKSLKDYKTFELWINGEYVKSCSHNFPLINKKTLKESNSKGYKDSGKVDFRYGIYRPNVGKWLMSNNKNHPQKLEYFRDPDGGETVVKYPFKLNWENKIPTSIIYYDEIRVGKSKDEVDINFQKKPVD